MLDSLTTNELSDLLKYLTPHERAEIDALLVTQSYNDDPEGFAAHYLKIMDKEDHLVPFSWNSIQREYYDKHTSRDLILKPRQIGFSTLIQGDFYRITTTESARTLTLTDSDDNTQKMRRMADRFHDNMPDERREKRKYANASVTTYSRFGSEAMIATAGNKQVGRSGSYRFIHLSEAAFYPDLQAILASALQGGKPQWVVIESTPNGAQGKFYEMCMAALAGDDVWSLHFYTWFDFAEYRLDIEPGETLTYSEEEARLVEKHSLTPEQIKWRRYKQAELGSPTLFQQEYAEDVVTCFLTSGNSVFGDFTHALYTPEADAQPIAGHRYTGGIDWGSEQNYSSLSIIDQTDNREVYLNRWRRMPWSDMRREMVEACRYWNVRVLEVEKNAAASNAESLKQDLEAAGLNVLVRAFPMTNKLKADMVANFYHALHEDGLKLINRDYATAEIRQFSSVQTPSGLWSYDSPVSADGAHGDTVIARLAAWYGTISGKLNLPIFMD